MQADELRQAVTRIVTILKRSDIRAALDGYRAARGEERAVAAARLGHSGAMIMERMEGLSPTERRVARLMHIESLGTSDYWQMLLGEESDAKAHQGEIVRLATRVMFATGQLPAMVALLEAVKEDAPTPDSPLADGQARFVIRLADAGEKASDPDRIARSIDGIDMLYSACASIARKPAMELRLDRIDGVLHRDLHFTGERDSLSAVIAVIESIPAALTAIDPDGDIDLEAIVGSLPVFRDLATLASLGTFSGKDLKDINDTMHQGALLVLESGVVLVEQPADEGAASRTPVSRSPEPPADMVVAPASTTVPPAPPRSSAPAPSAVVMPGPTNGTDPGIGETATGGTRPDVIAESAASGDAGTGGDQHYERYLREREAMQQAPMNGAPDNASGQRRDAVEELLRSLNQSRNGG